LIPLATIQGRGPLPGPWGLALWALFYELNWVS